MKHSPKEYLELQAIWDKKLKEAGFKDLEQRKDGLLKEWANEPVRKYTKQRADAKYEYYRSAGQFFHHFEFANKVEKRIFELHSEGISIRSIVKMLTVEKLWFSRGWRPNKRAVHETIQRLSRLMLSQLETKDTDV